MIGKKGSRENLFESILPPSKAIADQYVSWKIDTLDGQTITGLLVAGDAEPRSPSATPTARTTPSRSRTSTSRPRASCR